MFQALRAEVEALFMTGPSVSLEAVSTELQNMHTHVANEVRAAGLNSQECRQEVVSMSLAFGAAMSVCGARAMDPVCIRWF